jgi:molybdopterin-containing oxidoreductase family iron-sulfur binding subunit
MKRIWQHPKEPKTGKRFWRSTAELERRSEFLNTLGVEFPAGDTLDEGERENSRRDFLKLMGASAGKMGLAACRRPLRQATALRLGHADSYWCCTRGGHHP